MTREEQLKFCKICKHRKLSLKQGLICKISGEAADFEDSCPHYKEDAQAKAEIEARDFSIHMEENTASNGKRFANYLLDTIFYYVFIFIFFIVFGIMMNVVSPYAFDSIIDNHLFGYIIAILVYIFYYIVLETTTGRSIAKYITRTKVITNDGEQPNLRSIFIRSVCRLIPFDAFSFLGEPGIGWHDKLSKTRVIVIKK